MILFVEYIQSLHIEVMYVCMYIYIYICISLFVEYVQSLHIEVTYIHIYISMYTYIYIYIYIYNVFLWNTFSSCASKSYKSYICMYVYIYTTFFVEYVQSLHVQVAWMQHN